MTSLETRIAPSRGIRLLDWEELWRYRELFFFLAWRDIKVRYKQTVLGFAWALIQPLASIGVFGLFLSPLTRAHTEIPYPLYALAGIVPWSFFSKAVLGASNSLVVSSGLISKVYFPRVFIPMGTVGSGLADFVVPLGLLLIVSPFYGLWPSPALLTLPALALLLMALALGLSLFLSAFQARFRDIGYAIGYLFQLWMFATPVVYPLEAVPSHLRGLCLWNPMTGIVESFRSALLGTPWPVTALAISTGETLVLLFLGMLYFRWAERKLCDFL